MNIKYIIYIFCLGFLSILTSCDKEPQINLLCQKDNKGDFILRWEINPIRTSDMVSVYMSDNPYNFPNYPIKTVPASNFKTTITIHNKSIRRYFKLQVNDHFSPVITNRIFKMDSVQNFRDLGGYYNHEGKQIKWGQVYRSASLNNLTENDINTFNRLGIRTIIDFREEIERELYPTPTLSKQKIIILPIHTNAREYVKNRIMDKNLKRKDVIKISLKAYQDIVDENTKQFARFFEILSDEENYPILFHSYLGKDRTGIASYFLLRALEISNNNSDDDYLLSNLCISKKDIMSEARFYSEDMQEAITTLAIANILYLNYAKSFIRSQNGSIDNYMTQKLGLTQEKKRHLKKILLYK